MTYNISTTIHLPPLICNSQTTQHSLTSVKPIDRSSQTPNHKSSPSKMPDAKEQQPQMSEQDAANAKDPNHPAHPHHPHVCTSPYIRPNQNPIHIHFSGKRDTLILMSIVARRMDQGCRKEVWKRSRLRHWSDCGRGCCQRGFGTMMESGIQNRRGSCLLP